VLGASAACSRWLQFVPSEGGELSCSASSQHKIDRPDGDRAGRRAVTDRRSPFASEPVTVEAVPTPIAQRALRRLDWFIFFLGYVQTGFGPFVAVYLTTQKWTQVEIWLLCCPSVRGRG